MLIFVVLEVFLMVKNALGKLFRDDVDDTLIQLFRYIFVGGFAFIVDFSSLFILTDILGIYYLVSAAIAFILGLIANYVLSISWVFNKRTMGNVWSEFTIFAVIGMIGLGLNELIIYLFTDYVGLYYLASKIISAAIILFWNFFARKFTLFR